MRATTKKLRRQDERELRVQARTHGRNELGFLNGSDLDIATRVILEGGLGKQEVLDKLVLAFKGHKTSTGKPKQVSPLLNHVVKRAIEQGYVLEETWNLVAPKRKLRTPKKVKISRKRSVE